MGETRYVAIEGVPGVGKTGLAKLLSRKLGARLVLERAETNPFLRKFYDSPSRYAFQAQLYFLIDRYRQQQELHQLDLFHQLVVSDYLFDKERIFAYLNLDEHELALYERLISLIEPDIRPPDLVVYLQASTERIIRRVASKGEEYKVAVPPEYVRTLNEAYNKFFFHYDRTPLLVVNTSDVDLTYDPRDLDDLIEQIMEPHVGTRYYVPMVGSQERR